MSGYVDSLRAQVPQVCSVLVSLGLVAILCMCPCQLDIDVPLRGVRKFRIEQEISESVEQDGIFVYVLGIFPRGSYRSDQSGGVFHKRDSGKGKNPLRSLLDSDPPPSRCTELELCNTRGSKQVFPRYTERLFHYHVAARHVYRQQIRRTSGRF